MGVTTVTRLTSVSSGLTPTPGRDGSPPDDSMPDGSGGGEGSAPVPPPAGGAPAAGRTPGQKRKEPCYRGPRERGPYGWVTSTQQATCNKTTCRDCGHEFQGGEVRMSTLVNARGNRSSYSHVHCIPDELHPLDTLEHLTPLSHEQEASIEKVRLAKEDLGPTLPFAVLPRIVREATVVSGPAWWATRTWAGMRELHGLTLVDVPKQCWAKYADLVVQVIAEVESAEPAMLAGDSLPRELALMKLSVVDATVLNSIRFPGESQMVSVNRRIRNFHAEQWETLWLEATRTSGNRRDRTSRMIHVERERKVAARVEALAAAGQAKRAARAVAAKAPPIADPGREAELLALFPKPAPRGVREAEPPRVGYDLTPECLSAQAVARVRWMEASVAKTIKTPSRHSKPGPMATRVEHLENLKHSGDGVERIATLIVRLALGQGPRAVVRAHATGEVLAIEKPDGGVRPLIIAALA